MEESPTARIPDAEVERLKHEVCLQRLAAGMGVTLKCRGADLLGLCPFHDDHEPSLVISPKNNLWHCLGACQAGGSVIDWVMRAEGVSFRHAVELLQADHQPLAAGAVKRSRTQKLPTALETNADDARLLVQVTDYYHETLKQSPETLAYLEKRGIPSSKAIDRFRLGFANRTLGYRLPTKTRSAGVAIRGQLQRIGLLRASGHEHFNGSIVFPVINETGQVTEVYGRKIDDHLRPGTPYLARFLETSGALGLSPRTAEIRERMLKHFIAWCDERGIDKPGACHIFRHTMATPMLDNGADIRQIQAMLGHSQLSTTEIYTQVSIRKLKEIHALTHPADRPQ